MARSTIMTIAIAVTCPEPGPYLLQDPAGPVARDDQEDDRGEQR